MSKNELLTNAKPILFNTEMVKAIQDGRKVKTRRVINNDWMKVDELPIPANSCKSVWHFYHSGEHKSKYGIGDILYVRETFQEVLNPKNEDEVIPIFKVDYPIHWTATDTVYGDCDTDIEVHWKPSIHMPKKYARTFLKVTYVRVERLQDMDNTYDSYEKEGIKFYDENDIPKLTEEMFEEWRILWNSTSKDGYKWEDNPYVFVYEFEVINDI